MAAPDRKGIGRHERKRGREWREWKSRAKSRAQKISPIGRATVGGRREGEREGI